jgi:hypothetical protein
MKALSVKNPFAGLIVAGLKTYEVRSYKTSHRGKLAICSTQKDLGTDVVNYSNDDEDGTIFRLAMWSVMEHHNLLPTDAMPNGCILGMVDLIGVKEFTGGQEQENRAFVQLSAAQGMYPGKKLYLWELSNAFRIEPVPAKGKLGVFELNTKVIFSHAE